MFLLYHTQAMCFLCIFEGINVHRDQIDGGGKGDGQESVCASEHLVLTGGRVGVETNSDRGSSGPFCIRVQ